MICRIASENLCIWSTIKHEEDNSLDKAMPLTDIHSKIYQEIAK